MLRFKLLSVRGHYSVICIPFLRGVRNPQYAAKLWDSIGIVIVVKKNPMREMSGWRGSTGSRCA
jgi:hypothetical protein